MKKILIVGMTEGYGGIETFIMNIFRTLDKDKFQIDFEKNQECIAYEDEVTEKGANIFYVVPRGRKIFQHYKTIKKIFKENKYDVVWVHLCSLSSIGELVLAKRAGVPMRIIHAHNSNNMGGRLMGIMHKFNRLRIDKFATHKFTCSDEAKKYFYKNETDVVTIQNGIDFNKYYYNSECAKEVRQELKIKEDALVIGHVGRFDHIKNHTFLIDVFRLVHEQHKNTKLLLCGTGALVEETKEKVSELGLDDSVLFLGVRKDVHRVLQAVDFFLFPSKFEGLPFAAIEAQASGAKCLLSKNIDPDVKITDNVELLDIVDASVWADFVLANKDYKKRVMTELNESQFSLAKTCEIVEKKLCEG